MIVRCKNTYGDGTVEYVDYEVEVYTETDNEEASASDYEEALGRFGV